MNLLSPDDFALLEKDGRLQYVIDLCGLLEAWWSDKARRVRVQRNLEAVLESLAAEDDPCLRRVGLAGPTVHGLTSVQEIAVARTPAERALEGLRNGLAPVPAEDPTFVSSTGSRGTACSVPSRHVDGAFLRHQVFFQDRLEPAGPSMPLTVVLDNIRSAHNVGSILRSCETLQVRKVFLCGYTATPENPGLRRAAMGTDRLVDWSWALSTGEVVEKLRSAGTKVFALETAEVAVSLYEARVPPGSALVFGNERFGLSSSLLSACDGVLCIPLFGRKNSLNVANAFSVVAFELRRQWNLVCLTD